MEFIRKIANNSTAAGVLIASVLLAATIAASAAYLARGGDKNVGGFCKEVRSTIDTVCDLKTASPADQAG